MRISKKIQANRRHKSIPLVLNALDKPDNTIPASGDNIPTGLLENEASTLSSNLGTDRPLQGGRCIVGDGNLFVNIGDISYNRDNLTINMWVNPPVTTSGSNYTLLSKYISFSQPLDNEFFIAFALSGETSTSYTPRVRLNLQDESAYYLVSDTLTYPDIPYSLTFIKGVSYAKLLINGLEVAYVATSNSPIQTTTAPIQLYTLVSGANTNDGAKCWDLRIINNDISNEEVDDLLKYKNIQTTILQYKLDDYGGVFCKNSNGNLSFYRNISNYYEGMWGTQDEYSWQDEVGFSESDGVTYFRNASASPTIQIGEFISRDESEPTKCVAYLSDGTQADLQYKGAAPSRAEFKESPCWLGDGISYYSITGLLTTDVITAFGSSDIPSCTIDGILNLASGGKAYGILIQRGGVDWAYITFSEQIEDATTHISYNTLQANSGKDATLIDGSFSNQGSQDEYHYLQLGFYHNGNQQVPVLSDMSAYADGTVLSSGVQQYGNSFLNTGTKLAVVKTPRIVDAEKVNRLFTDANNDVVNKSHSDFTGVILDQDFSDISETDKIKNIRKHNIALEGRQLITDKIITNN